MTNVYQKAINIRSKIAKQHGLTVKELISDSKEFRIVRAKHEAWYWTKENTNLVYSEIGMLYNNDRSVVQRGYMRYKRKINKEIL